MTINIRWEVEIIKETKPGQKWGNAFTLESNDEKKEDWKTLGALIGENIWRSMISVLKIYKPFK